MLEGTVKWYRADWRRGYITPGSGGGRDVRFLRDAFEHPDDPYEGQTVQYELYEGNDEPHAKKVVPT